MPQILKYYFINATAFRWNVDSLCFVRYAICRLMNVSNIFSGILQAHTAHNDPLFLYFAVYSNRAINGNKNIAHCT